MRVHLVGAGGFVGSHLSVALGRAGVEVVGPEVALGVDALVFVHGGRASPEEVHVELTRRLLHELRPRRALLLSSGEVYGAVPVPFREDGPIAPSSAYGLAKRRAEDIVLGHRFEDSGGGRVVRAGVVYGPGQRGAMLVPTLVEALSRGEPIALTPGAQTRDFIHVEDLVALIVRVLMAEEAPPIVNAGLGVEVTVRTIAERLARLVGERTGRELSGCLRFGAVPYRADEPMRYALSCERARSLGWAPRRELEDGLAELVALSVPARPPV